LLVCNRLLLSRCKLMFRFVTHVHVFTARRLDRFVAHWAVRLLLAVFALIEHLLSFGIGGAMPRVERFRWLFLEFPGLRIVYLGRFAGIRVDFQRRRVPAGVSPMISLRCRWIAEFLSLRRACGHRAACIRSFRSTRSLPSAAATLGATTASLKPVQVDIGQRISRITVKVDVSFLAGRI